MIDRLLTSNRHDRGRRIDQDRLNERKRTDAYHHFMKGRFMDLSMIWDLVHGDDGVWEKVMSAEDMPYKTNTQNIQWIKEHLEKIELDPLDMGAIEGRDNIFTSLGAFNKVAISMLPVSKQEAKQMAPEALVSDRVTMLLWWHIYNIWRHKGQMFQIQPGLAEKLYLTDVHQVQWSDIHTPFPSFVLHIPSYLCSIEAERTGWHEVDTVFVTRCNNIPLRDGRFCAEAISLYFMGRENKNSIEQYDDAAFFINLFPNDQGIEASIQTSLGNPCWVNPEVKEMMRNQEGEMAENAVARTVRFVISCLLYISMKPEDVRKADFPPKWHKTREQLKTLTGKKRKNAARRLKDIEAAFGPRPFLVGRKVVIDKELSKAARVASRARGAVQSASYVRGHMRNQPHGPGRTLRKMIWIEPHMRGLGEAAEKSYEVR